MISSYYIKILFIFLQIRSKDRGTKRILLKSQFIFIEAEMEFYSQKKYLLCY